MAPPKRRAVCFVSHRTIADSRSTSGICHSWCIGVAPSASAPGAESAAAPSPAAPSAGCDGQDRTGANEHTHARARLDGQTAAEIRTESAAGNAWCKREGRGGNKTKSSCCMQPVFGRAADYSPVVAGA